MGPHSEPNVGAGPLDDLRVLDLSRLLPGAVLARGLIDLGARLIKVESPPGGDMMRAAPPLLGSAGAGFSSFLRGAFSWSVDLRDETARDAVIQAIADADVVIESFRPRTLASMGIDLGALHERCPRLISVSLPSANRDSEMVAHDLNLSAASGLLSAMRPGGGRRAQAAPLTQEAPGDVHELPWVQVSDVMTGQLALSAVLAALYERARTGRGRRIVQPLSSGALPLITWLWADHAALSHGDSLEDSRDGSGESTGEVNINRAAESGPASAPARHTTREQDPSSQLSLPRTLLAGHVPAYRLYVAQDGLEIALACVEPKFWITFLELVGASQWRHMGLIRTPLSTPCAQAIAAIMTTRTSNQWEDLARQHSLPLSIVAAFPGDPISSRFLRSEGYLEHTRSAGPTSAVMEAVGSWFPSFARQGLEPLKVPELGSANKTDSAKSARPFDKRAETDGDAGT